MGRMTVAAISAGNFIPTCAGDDCPTEYQLTVHVAEALVEH